MTREEAQELVPFYALGVLDATENRELERYLRQASEQDRREAAEFREIAALLPYALLSPAVPAALKGKLLNGLAEEVTASTPQPANVLPFQPKKQAVAPRRMTEWLAAAAALVLAAGSALLYWQNTQLKRENLALTQQDLSERKSARRLGYDIDLTNNANSFIERRTDRGPDNTALLALSAKLGEAEAYRKGKSEAASAAQRRGSRSRGRSNQPSYLGPQGVSPAYAAMLAQQMYGNYAGQMNNAAAMTGVRNYGPHIGSNRYPTQRTPEQYADIQNQQNERMMWESGRRMLPTYQQPVSPLRIPGGPPQGMGPYYA